MGCMDALPIVLPDQGPIDQALMDANIDAETRDMDPDGDVGPPVILEVGYGDPASFMLAPGSGTATAVSEVLTRPG